MKEYIEREAAISAVIGCTHIYTSSLGGRCVILPSEARKRLTGVPTADVAPVRHGAWEVLEHYMNGDTARRCSECRELMFLHRSVSKAYCPNCGAKMDEKKEGGEEA